MKDIVTLLDASKLFASVSQEAKQKLADDHRSIALDKGQLLFSKGDPADAVYVITSGDVAIEVLSEQGRTVRMATLKKGAVFGEIAVLDGGERTADARAVYKTELVRIPKATFISLAKEEASLSFAILSDLVMKMRKTNVQVENISFQPLRVRLALLLDDLSKEAEKGTIHITQFEIADRLSATREKVNVHLQAIQKAGAIKIGRGKITVTDTAELTTFIENA